MQVKRRAHPLTIPGSRFYRDANGRSTGEPTSVPVRRFRGASRFRAMTECERETMRRTVNGRTLPRGDKRMAHVIGYQWVK